MVKIELIILGVILIFIYINLCWTQKIYHKGKFINLTIFAIVISIITVILAKTGAKIDALNFGILILNYTWLLWLLKKNYRKVNSYLISKKFVDISFANKDFTYVWWDGDNPTAGNWWDEKRATKPSWFDHVITLALLILPISLTLPITYLT